MREKSGLRRTAGREGERGVALIIVLGFLGLMLMMAVAFMTQARVERLVSDSSTEAMRARQIAQTGIAAGIQDYVNAIQQLESQSDDRHDIFLSGDHDTGQYSFAKETYGTTNLWRGKVKDWVWPWHKEGTGDDNVRNMQWIWVGEEPGKMSRILGRYAYACFDMSGAVDANLLGREFGQNLKESQYGAQTNRNNVRKMVLDAVRAKPEMSTDGQQRLAQYQEMWQGFDTPLALKKLTDGKVNDGQDGGENRWSAIGIDESGVGQLGDDYLSCYSYAAFHKGSGDNERWECSTNIVSKSSDFRVKLGKLVEESVDVMRPDVKTWAEKALEDYMGKGDVPQGTDYPSVKAVPMFNEFRVKLELTNNANEGGVWRSGFKMAMDVEFWYPFPSTHNELTNDYLVRATNVVMGAGTASEQISIRYRAKLQDGSYVQTVLYPRAGAGHEWKIPRNTTDKKTLWEDGNPTNVTFEYEIPFPDTVTQKVVSVQLDDINISGMKLVKVSGMTTNKVDSMPDKLKISWEKTRPTIYADSSQGPTEMSAFAEVIDPRLNHLDDMWVSADKHSLGKKNDAAKEGQEKAERKLGYKPGSTFFCRNGAMKSPAELGYIPVWDGKTTWMTLDIFSEEGIELMNRLVCTNAMNWNMLDSRSVYYTNGTINPYTRDQAVLNGAFYGLDLRVPGCKGKPGTKDVLGVGRTTNLTAEIIKTETPDNLPFRKDGPAGWARALRYKGLSLDEEGASLDKNQRIALLHNTWGLFNESDKLFVIVVVAQSISEAPEKVDRVGHWNPDEDEITGERWAVALCWTDASADVGQDLTKETDIIMFQYLNE